MTVSLYTDAGGNILPCQYRSYAVETGIEHYSLVCMIGTGLIHILIFVHICICMHVCMCIWVRVETGSGHPGQPGHVLSGSSRSDPVYKIFGSDPNSALNHVQ